MAKSSIHIVPIKANSSETHNLRLKEYEHVRSDLTEKNQSWSKDTVKDRMESIQVLVKEKTGRKLQRKASPLREGVFLIKDNTKLEDVKMMTEKLQKRFGIEAIQIHLHHDEGHFKKPEKESIIANVIESPEWKPNLHGHVVFDWTDKETGKSIKLNRSDLSEMQTIVADSLGMERGISSDRKHLDPVSFKNQVGKKDAEKLTNDLVVTSFGIVKKDETRENVSELAHKHAKLEKNYSLLVDRAEKEKLSFKQAENTLKTEVSSLKEKLIERKTAFQKVALNRDYLAHGIKNGKTLDSFTPKFQSGISDCASRHDIRIEKAKEKKLKEEKAKEIKIKKPNLSVKKNPNKGFSR